MFHAFTGCDTVSFFASVGKKTCWDVWMSDPEFTRVFLKMLTITFPQSLSDISLAVERFVSLMYDKTSTLCRVNDTRKYLFTKRERKLETIPPTQAALKEHTKRAILQTLLWKEAVIPQPEDHNPEDWGYIQRRYIQPFLDSYTRSIKNLQWVVKCGCRQGCRGNCKRLRTDLPCTSLCACDANCQRD